MDACESELAGTTAPQRVTMSYRPGWRRGVNQPDESDAPVRDVQAGGTSVVQDSYYPLPRTGRGGEVDLNLHALRYLLTGAD